MPNNDVEVKQYYNLYRIDHVVVDEVVTKRIAPRWEKLGESDKMFWRACHATRNCD